MVNLKALIEYFQGLCWHPSAPFKKVADVPGRIRGIKGFVVDTITPESGKKYQGLEKWQLPVLSLLLPTAQSDGSDADSMVERNTVVIILLDKFDPQRKDAVAVCVETQPLIEAVKALMLEDVADGCQLLDGLNLNSFSTMPETGIYGNLAGWSVGFTFDTVGFADEFTWPKIRPIHESADDDGDDDTGAANDGGDGDTDTENNGTDTGNGDTGNNGEDSNEVMP